MQTILDTWRNKERNVLANAYNALEAAVRSEGRISLEKICQAFSIKRRDIETPSIDVGGNHVISLADGKIELSNDPTRQEYHLRQIESWRRELNASAKWGRHSEVDEHIIHMHMVRIHGDDFHRISRPHSYGVMPVLAGALETDDLSLHLLSTRCEDIDSRLAVEPTTSLETRKDIVKKALRTLIRNTSAGWYTIPGMKRRGIHVSADYTNHPDGMIMIEGDLLTVHMDKLPSSVLPEALDGKPLHSLVDIAGYRNDRMIMKLDTSLPGRCLYRLNRQAVTQRIRINLDHRTLLARTNADKDRDCAA